MRQIVADEYEDFLPAIRERFARIGLALSGGGYRAAAFHLGALDQLHRLGLLDRVTMLSTVSGGTFTGLVFAMSQVTGEPFEQARDRFVHFLTEENLLAAGLAQLRRGASDIPSGRRSLIAALAQVYSETLLSHEGRPWRLAELQDADIPLQEAVFNATELRYGEAFRFQRSHREDAVMGSRRIPLPAEVAGAVRLGDVLAASSAFPGGFEPLEFPGDFAWPQGEPPPDLPAGTRCALSDGGVFDNQGIAALLAADGRSPEDLDLFVISDVDRQEEDLYSIEGPTEGWLTLGNLVRVLVAVIGACAVSGLCLGALLVRDLAGVDGLQLTFGYLVPLVLVWLVVGGLVYLLVKAHRDVLKRIPVLQTRSWRTFRRLSLREVQELAEIRARSMFAITSNVFTSRIRSLVYGLVYRDPAYNDKRVSNLVVSLRSDPPPPPVEGIPAPSEELTAVADRAAAMPTTLWFEDRQQLDDLMACGRFTLTWNLLKYLLRTQQGNEGAQPEAMRALWARLMRDWQAFNRDPYC